MALDGYCRVALARLKDQRPSSVHTEHLVGIVLMCKLALRVQVSIPKTNLNVVSIFVDLGEPMFTGELT